MLKNFDHNEPSQQKKQNCTDYNKTPKITKQPEQLVNGKKSTPGGNIIFSNTKIIINSNSGSSSSSNSHHNKEVNNRLNCLKSKIPIYNPNQNNHHQQRSILTNCQIVSSTNNNATFLLSNESNQTNHKSIVQLEQWNKFLSKQISSLKLSAADLPFDIKLSQYIHNRIQHCHRHRLQQQNLQHCHHHLLHQHSCNNSSKTTSCCSSSFAPSSPRSSKSSGTHTPTTTSNNSIITMDKKNNTNSNKKNNLHTYSLSCLTNHKKNVYEEYLPLCEMQKGLQKGEIIEGVLRIKQKNYNEAYITAPDGGLDVFIKNLSNRNRAMNGDQVAVRINDKKSWMISYSMINSNWSQWHEDFEKLTIKVLTVNLDSLTLNSKDEGMLNQIKLGSVKNGYHDQAVEMSPVKTEVLLREIFPSLPLEVFSLKIEELCREIPYWNEFIQRTGHVVNILQQNHPRTFAGIIKLNDNNMLTKNSNKRDKYIQILPCDVRNPKLIVQIDSIPDQVLKSINETCSTANDSPNTLFMVKITEWNSSSLYPFGEIIESIGKCGNIQAETDIALRSFDIDCKEFSNEILEQYQSFFKVNNWKIPENEFEYRRDFRRHCVFTIDPETAKDLDDAISYRILDDERIEIGVHIADVSWFIQENSPLDLIAKNRATSVYLVEKVIPMLPHLFCQELCSLNPGEDKLTFSVVFICDRDGKCLERWFGRTVINSCIKLSYDHAQKMIDAQSFDRLDQQFFPEIMKNSVMWNMKNVYNSVRSLNEVIQKITKKRFESGSIRIDKRKLNFILDDAGQPMAFFIRQTKNSNRLIEELMLMANKAVAERLYDVFGSQGRAFLRFHPPLSQNHLNEIVKFIQQKIDFEFDVSSTTSINDSLLRIAHYDQSLFQLCSLFVIKFMKLAQYRCVDAKDLPKSYQHYALNFEKYTHFTSPIRRYADVIVHRLLATSLGYQNSKTERSKDELIQIAENCNKRKYNAFLVSEKSSEIHLKAYIFKFGAQCRDAIVFQVFDHSFDVLVLDFDFVTRVYVDQLQLESFQFRKDKNGPQLILQWKTFDDDQIEGDNNQIADLSQSIKSFVELKVKLFVTEKFEFKTIIAHPCGKF